MHAWKSLWGHLCNICMWLDTALCQMTLWQQNQVQLLTDCIVEPLLCQCTHFFMQNLWPLSALLFSSYSHQVNKRISLNVQKYILNIVNGFFVHLATSEGLPWYKHIKIHISLALMKLNFDQMLLTKTSSISINP